MSRERWLPLRALGPVLLALSAHAVLAGMDERRLINEVLESQARSLGRLWAKPAAAAIEVDDRQEVDALLEHLAREPDVEFALVQKATGELTSYVGDAALRASRERQFASSPLDSFVTEADTLSFVAPVELAARPPARLVVGMRTSRADAALLVKGVIMLLVEATAVMLVVLWLVRGLRRRSEGLERQRATLWQTGRLAQVGGWELLVEGDQLRLSDEASALLSGGSGPEQLLRDAALCACIQTGEAFDLEVELKGERSRWLRVQGQAEQVQGKTVRVLGAVQDVTERRLASELALAGSRAKSQFLANTSHELRTPLNGIIGLTELTLESSLTAEQRGQLETVRQSGRAMLAIVNDLLDIARIESGKMTLESVPMDLETLLLGTTHAFAAQAREKGVVLKVVVPPTLASKRLGDPLRFSQLVNNLVDNAVKFTAQGTVEVGLEAGSTPEEVHLRVCDTGIGIPPERQSSIFEAFTQSDGSTSRRFGGTGLGLTIARELVTMMGGSMSLVSASGRGSTFTARLRLPLMALAVTQQSEPMQPAPAQDLGRRLKVLLAEDNAINAMVARRLVEREGHEVTHVLNGSAAVTAVREGIFDLVLMDLQMPELDGLEATRRIRDAERLTDCHQLIFALTANAMRADEEQCMAVGMDGFLAKPVDPSRLRRVLKSVSTVGKKVERPALVG